MGRVIEAFQVGEDEKGGLLGPFGVCHFSGEKNEI